MILSDDVAGRHSHIPIVFAKADDINATIAHMHVSPLNEDAGPIREHFSVRKDAPPYKASGLHGSVSIVMLNRCLRLFLPRDGFIIMMPHI